MRITVACPEGLIADANHLAMVLAFSSADGETYQTPEWQDAAGNLYAAASFEALPEWIMSAQSELVRPDWDADGLIDMEAAARAQAVLVFSTEALPASPEALTAIGGMGGLAALTAMGVTQIGVD
jgi:hypothetical protein